MTTKLSSKRKVVLPLAVCQELGMEPGVDLTVTLENERVVLSCLGERREAWLIKDPVSGLPVLTTGAGSRQVTSEQVAAILTNFP